jgi:hypothetical protein
MSTLKLTTLVASMITSIKAANADAEMGPITINPDTRMFEDS